VYYWPVIEHDKKALLASVIPSLILLLFSLSCSIELLLTLNVISHSNY
jgi:hypothetical protein